VFASYRASNPSRKKKLEKRKKNGNASLPFVNLHLYNVFGLKQATIVNFDALFETVGIGGRRFGAIFLVFYGFLKLLELGEEIQILLI
jgi:hypothetical protein